MQAQLLQWLDAPTFENFQSLCQTVADHAEYNPYSDTLPEAEELLAQESYEEAIQLLMEQMANLIVSPHAHMLLAFAAQQLGDTNRYEAEASLATLLLESILNTGDGSRERPYHVLRVSDEYDVLNYLDKQPQRQSLHEDKKRHLDCQQCADGTSIWFDITVPHRRLSEVLKGEIS
jgi:hypothetical protein